MKDHKIFQRNEKFTLIEQITETCTTTKQLRLLLKKVDNLLILKLKTLYPDGLEAPSLSSSV